MGEDQVLVIHERLIETESPRLLLQTFVIGEAVYLRTHLHLIPASTKHFLSFISSVSLLAETPYVQS